jgi:hypothetical protein
VKVFDLCLIFKRRKSPKKQFFFFQHLLASLALSVVVPSGTLKLTLMERQNSLPGLLFSVVFFGVVFAFVDAQLSLGFDAAAFP